MDVSKYTRLDRPEILPFVFYPRRETGKGPAGSTDYSIPVAEGISIGCRFYVHSAKSPSILFFHGNGEIANDYDYIAPLYNEMGINLFVADYRGYGSSNGTPSFTGMVKDAHSIFRAFVDLLNCGGHNARPFVMGRSLGSMSAIELAASYPSQIAGLIVESGFASVMRLLTHLGFPPATISLDDISFPNAARIREVSLPTLIIHGDFDTIVPLSEAKDLFENSTAKDKRLLVINGAGHNDIMMTGGEQYFSAVKKVVLGAK